MNSRRRIHHLLKPHCGQLIAVGAVCPALRRRSPDLFCSASGGFWPISDQILDCLVEIKPPFNPTEAVAQIADVLRSYQLHRTTGDKYAALWVIEAFSRCGIRYEHSERDRSALYLDCLPLFTSGRARLLDSKRLATQFASLERRTSPIGKDRVDHGPGGHDDLCNSAGGAMVLALGAAPGLWASEALLVNGAPAPTPTRCEVAYAVLLQGLGSVATVYFCRSRPVLTIVDFEVMPLAPTAFTSVGSRLIDLGKATRTEHGPFLFTNTALAEELLRLGHRAVVIDALAAEDAAMLATSAAGSSWRPLRSRGPRMFLLGSSPEPRATTMMH
jgi:hypothetical protein